MEREDVKKIIELFISWNGESDAIDVANLDAGADYVYDCISAENDTSTDSSTVSMKVNGDTEWDEIYKFMRAHTCSDSTIYITNAL